jgi:hypothetical protein
MKCNLLNVNPLNNCTDCRKFQAIGRCGDGTYNSTPDISVKKRAQLLVFMHDVLTYVFDDSLPLIVHKLI